MKLWWCRVPGARSVVLGVTSMCGGVVYQAHYWWCLVPGASVRLLSPGQPEVVLMVMLFRMLAVFDQVVDLLTGLVTGTRSNLLQVEGGRIAW